MFSMVAVDQRPPIVQLIAKARGVPAQAVGFADIARVKRLLVQGLAEDASALLVDPNFAYPACSDLLRPDRGLVLTLEEHRFQETDHGRLSASIADWSVEKIRHIGGDAVKVLAWYRPDAAPAVIAHQQAYVQQVGDACARAGLPFILELLVYPLQPADQGADTYVEDPTKRPALVIDSVRAFADACFGVDLFKLESPIPMHELTDPDHADALPLQAQFDLLGAACGDRPWVMLSAGASMQAFARTVRFACRAGASGFLAGRSLWSDAAALFPDEEAMLAGLRNVAVERLHALQDIVRNEGRAWRHPLDAEHVRAEGDFARSIGSPPEPMP
jgi:tagatose 1,6-diphosphate aldolase